MTYLVLRNFHVYALTGETRMVNGQQFDVEKRVDFRRGMTLLPADVPAGHDAAHWIATGLVRDGSEPNAAGDDNP